MPDRIRNRTALLLSLAVAAATMPAVSLACCPSGGNGDLAPKASTSGLGEAFPDAVNVSSDSRWSVYQFTRRGLNYTQINDASGVVRAGIGSIGSTAWVLPAGTDADRVLLPGDVVPAGTRKTLYKSAAIEVVVIETSTRPYWLILPAETAY